MLFEEGPDNKERLNEFGNSVIGDAALIPSVGP